MVRTGPKFNGKIIDASVRSSSVQSDRQRDE